MSSSTPSIYLDNNATTQPHPEVLEAVARVMQEGYANPGSRHSLGRQARRILEEARERISSLLGAQPDELIFTSGGTESINLALRGLAFPPKGILLSPPGEHPATTRTIEQLEQNGWKSAPIPLKKSGEIDEAALSTLPWAEARLVSILLAHNETGVIQEVTSTSQFCEEHRIPLHLDAVQAVGKIPVDFQALNATALSFGAHKFHGPRGVGGLLLKKGCRLHSQQVGGHQETNRRAGTEPVALIAGMAKALEIAVQKEQERQTRLKSMRDRFEAGLQEKAAPIVINGISAKRLPNTSNIAFPGLEGEALLVALDLAGIACSMGSACESGSAEPAPILIAMQTPPEVYQSSLRFSLSLNNSEEEIDEAIHRIAEVVNRMRSL